jgi:hypothetical protein
MLSNEQAHNVSAYAVVGPIHSPPSSTAVVFAVLSAPLLNVPSALRPGP